VVEGVVVLVVLVVLMMLVVFVVFDVDGGVTCEARVDEIVERSGRSSGRGRLATGRGEGRFLDCVGREDDAVVDDEGNALAAGLCGCSMAQSGLLQRRTARLLRQLADGDVSHGRAIERAVERAVTGSISGGLGWGRGVAGVKQRQEDGRDEAAQLLFALVDAAVLLADLFFGAEGADGG
jgi:hypothetical protein